VYQVLTTYLKNNRLQFIFCILILIFIGVKWSIGLSQHLDILFGDEAEYMRNGLDLFKIIRNDWGPSYNIWYKFLSLYFSDVLELYYANYVIGGIAVSVLLFIALSSCKVDKLIALGLSFCFFVSSVNINTWPRISHFVVSLLLIAVILFSKVHSKAKKSLVFASVCFVCGYARPELFFAFILLTFASLYFLYKEKKEIKSNLIYILILVLLVVLFQTVFGLPGGTYKDGLNRLYSAFCQHYTINYRYRTGIQFDAVTEWIEFCKLKFPDCQTIVDIMLKHPIEFLHHFLFNVKNYALLFLITISSFVFPVELLHSKKAILLASVILFALIFLVLFFKDKRNFFLRLLKQHHLLLLFLFIFGLPSIGMSTIIFPRPHYILLHSIFIIFLLAFLLQSLFSKATFKYWQLFGIGLLLLPLAPRANDYKYIQFGKDMENLCEQKLIRYFESKKNKEYVVFTNYLNITYILPKNYSEFSTEFELKKGMSFATVLQEEQINVILVSINILKNPILMADSTWNELIAHPEKYGFKRVNYSDICESYLLIKE